VRNDDLVEDRPLSEAMMAYVGEPGKLDPLPPEERVASRVGKDAAVDLLPRLRAILDAMYGADPPLHHVATERELGRRAEEWLRTNHPELSPGAVRAVANRFAFDWR
jgi:hypothetical protein